MGERYTIEDFMNGKIYVQCNNEEERQLLKILSGWNGEEDALVRRKDPAALYRHRRHAIIDGYCHTHYSRIGAPFYKELPIVRVGDLEEAVTEDILFDDAVFMAMLGCGGDG